MMKPFQTLMLPALALVGCGGEAPPDTATHAAALSTTFQQWTSSQAFQGAMTNSNVVVLTGDFDSNDRDDIAILTRGSRWVGRAYNSRYSLGTLNDARWLRVDGLNGEWVQQAQHFVVGDFNGDTFEDIALLGIPNHTTVPIIFGATGGDFFFLEAPGGLLPLFSTHPGAQVVAGDFDGDGKDDIAMAGGSNWTSIVIGFSTGFTFDVEYDYEPGFSVWAKEPGAQLVAGDFDGDGKHDIALAGGAAFSSVAIARYADDEEWFDVGTAFSPYIVVEPKQAGARVLVGDYDGDGDDDFAVAGAAGKTHVYFTFCHFGGETFSLTDDSAYQPFFASYAASTNAILSGRLSHDTKDDIYYPSAQNYSLHALIMGRIRGG